MELISLVEYAELNGIASATARQRAIRGSFKTARKIGRNWVIDKTEPLTDNRIKENNTMKTKRTFEEFLRIIHGMGLAEYLDLNEYQKKALEIEYKDKYK